MAPKDCILKRGTNKLVKGKKLRYIRAKRLYGSSYHQLFKPLQRSSAAMAPVGPQRPCPTEWKLGSGMDGMGLTMMSCSSTTIELIITWMISAGRVVMCAILCAMLFEQVR